MKGYRWSGLSQTLYQSRFDPSCFVSRSFLASRTHPTLALAQPSPDDTSSLRCNVHLGSSISHRVSSEITIFHARIDAPALRLALIRSERKKTPTPSSTSIPATARNPILHDILGVRGDKESRKQLGDIANEERSLREIRDLSSSAALARGAEQGDALASTPDDADSLSSVICANGESVQTTLHDRLCTQSKRSRIERRPSQVVVRRQRDPDTPQLEHCQS